MSVSAIDEARFHSVIDNAGEVVLVDFFATWCMPCKMLSPVVDEISEESDGSYDVYKCDIDENEALCMEFSVVSVPTLIIFKDGKEVDRLVGVRSKQEILNAVRSAV